MTKCALVFCLVLVLPCAMVLGYPSGDHLENFKYDETSKELTADYEANKDYGAAQYRTYRRPCRHIVYPTYAGSGMDRLEDPLHDPKFTSTIKNYIRLRREETPIVTEPSAAVEGAGGTTSTADDCSSEEPQAGLPYVHPVAPQTSPPPTMIVYYDPSKVQNANQLPQETAKQHYYVADLPKTQYHHRQVQEAPKHYVYQQPGQPGEPTKYLTYPSEGQTYPPLLVQTHYHHPQQSAQQQQSPQVLYRQVEYPQNAKFTIIQKPLHQQQPQPQQQQQQQVIVKPTYVSQQQQQQQVVEQQPAQQFYTIVTGQQDPVAVTDDENCADDALIEPGFVQLPEDQEVLGNPDGGVVMINDMADGIPAPAPVMVPVDSGLEPVVVPEEYMPEAAAEPSGVMAEEPCTGGAEMKPPADREDAVIESKMAEMVETGSLGAS